MRLRAAAVAAFLVLSVVEARADACTMPSECTSGFCVDGVCCDSACTGTCEACDLAASMGTCVPVVGLPHHGSCPTTSDVCGTASCDGVTRNECKKFPGAEKECRTSTCVDGTETPSARCDGAGACPAPTTKPCGAYVCDGNKCRTTCRSTPDCASGFTCDEIDKKCLAADTCDGEHTIKSRNGATKDCTPYKCDKTQCLNACIATSQCTTGFVCDGKECVRSTLDAPTGAEDDGGCAFGASSRWNGAGLAFGVLALGLLRRRYSPTCGSRGSSRRSARTSPTK